VIASPVRGVPAAASSAIESPVVTPNVEVVRRCLEAFESDVHDWRATLDPEFEWTPFEEGTVSHGLTAAEGVRDRWLGSFRDHRLEVRGIRARGDDVVATVHLEGQGATSGVEVSVDLYLHFRLRDGRIIYLFEHTDPAAALEAAGLGEFEDDFDGAALDTGVWVPHYLPQWSSRAASAATYEVTGSELRLTIPPEQGLWCADDHEPPLKVSGVQSGVFSGPVGSPVGQQPFREGQAVREFQPAQWGWTPHHGVLEVRARMDLSPRSMASVWMVGLEDEPDRCGEICIFEVFGETLEADGGRPSAAVGMGVHPFRDPALTDEFDAPRMPIDVSEFHVYAADWRPGGVDFTIDGRHVKSVGQAPAYPMQMMVAVFDFPDKAASALDPDHVPVFAVDFVRGRPADG
jgi:ketosteroid isomerase-like protein